MNFSSAIFVRLLNQFRVVAVVLSIGVIAIVIAAQADKSLETSDISYRVKPAFLPVFNKSDEQAYTTYSVSSDVQIHQLGRYRYAASGVPFTSIMLFSATPTSTTEAQIMASDMMQRLDAVSIAGLTPIVIMEPTTAITGSSLDFRSYERGAYDDALRSYFSKLQRLGVDSAELGKWVFFPEANTPAWQESTDPKLFSENVTRSAHVLKSYFPAAHVSILLNSSTFADGKVWEHPEYSSLVPYVSGLPPHLIDSVGLQGFPDYNPSDQQTMPPDRYLDYHLVKDAADTLGTRDIWFNTGTIGREYVGSQSEIRIKATDRALLLSQAAQEVVLADQAGYHVSVSLFAADKSETTEATDWSYTDRGSQTALKRFVRSLHAHTIGVGVFDSNQ